MQLPGSKLTQACQTLHSAARPASSSRCMNRQSKPAPRTTWFADLDPVSGWLLLPPLASAALPLASAPPAVVPVLASLPAWLFPLDPEFVLWPPERLIVLPEEESSRIWRMWERGQGGRSAHGEGWVRKRGRRCPRDAAQCALAYCQPPGEGHVKHGASHDYISGARARAWLTPSELLIFMLVGLLLEPVILHQAHTVCSTRCTACLQAACI